MLSFMSSSQTLLLNFDGTNLNLFSLFHLRCVPVSGCQSNDTEMLLESGFMPRSLFLVTGVSASNLNPSHCHNLSPSQISALSGVMVSPILCCSPVCTEY